MINQPAAAPSNYDEWLIDALAKQPADPAAAADLPAAAAARASIINQASLYQLQAFLEDQRDIRLLNSQNGRGEDALIMEAWGSDLELAQARITAKLAALFSTQPAQRQ
jgi:hypothetical protein